MLQLLCLGHSNSFLLSIKPQVVATSRLNYFLLSFGAICVCPLAVFDRGDGYLFALDKIQRTSVIFVAADGLVFASATTGKLEESLTTHVV